jgi:DNA-directed RNA polymerase subunit RPC12/RpoP
VLAVSRISDELRSCPRCGSRRFSQRASRRSELTAG